MSTPSGSDHFPSAPLRPEPVTASSPLSSPLPPPALGEQTFPRRTHAERIEQEAPLLPNDATIPVSSWDAWSASPYSYAPYGSGFHAGPRGPQGTTPPVGRATLLSLIFGAGATGMLLGALLTIVLLRAFPLPAASGSARQPSSSSASAQTLPAASPAASATAPASVTATAPTTAATATFIAQDTTTQGSWQGVYGSQGADVAGDTQTSAGALQVTQNGASEYIWQDSADDPRATQKASGGDGRIAACWYANTSFSFALTAGDGQAHQVALYLLDWDGQNRVETVSVLDPATNAVLDTHTVSNFSNGVYLVWNVRGSVTLQITNGPGSLNAVASGLFVGAGQAQ